MNNKTITITAREAARRRMPLDGADAQALEGALAMTERELAVAVAARAESEAALGLLREGWDAMARERDAYREKAARPMSHAVMTLDRCDRCGWPTAADGCAPGRCIAPDLRRVREEVSR